MKGETWKKHEIISHITVLEIKMKQSYRKKVIKINISFLYDGIFDAHICKDIQWYPRYLVALWIFCWLQTNVQIYSVLDYCIFQY